MPPVVEALRAPTRIDVIIVVAIAAVTPTRTDYAVANVDMPGLTASVPEITVTISRAASHAEAW